MEPKRFTAAAILSMTAYSWPGNARQLENEIKRLVASVRSRAIGAEHLALEARSPSEFKFGSGTSDGADAQPSPRCAGTENDSAGHR